MEDLCQRSFFFFPSNLNLFEKKKVREWCPAPGGGRESAEGQRQSSAEGQLVWGPAWHVQKRHWRPCGPVGPPVVIAGVRDVGVEEAEQASAASALLYLF